MQLCRTREQGGPAKCGDVISISVQIERILKESTNSPGGQREEEKNPISVLSLVTPSPTCIPRHTEGSIHAYTHTRAHAHTHIHARTRTRAHTCIRYTSIFRLADRRAFIFH